jgi:soluble lytic murein transglycosylase-like protein
MKVKVILILALLFSSASIASAELYKYIDEDGNLYFTNVPTDYRWTEIKKNKKARSVSNKVTNRSKFDYHIKRAASKYGLNPALVKAVVRQESDFDPAAVSEVGACGLMQLMPGTADLMNVKNIFDPQDNIFGGSRYLSQMLEMFGGNVSYALAAFNSGPNNVKKHKGIPPFEQTQDFVQKVLKYYRQYRSEMQ